MTNEAEVSTADAASWWEDPIDVVTSPVQLFQRRRDAPLWPPLGMIIAGAIVAYLVMLPVTGMVMEAQMAANPEAAAAMERFGTIFRVVGALFAPIGLLFVLAWTALLLWAFGRLLDVPASFSRMLLVAVYAGWIVLIGQLLGGVILMATGTDAISDLASAISFGVLRFTGTEGMPRTVVPLLARLDLFALWQAALWMIGISTFYRVSRGRAVAIALAVLVLSALPEVLLALLPQPGAR